MERTLRETIDHALRLLTESQWEHDYDSRYNEEIKRCNECHAKAIDEHREALRHNEDCPLVETLRELTALSVALNAKEDAGEDPTLDATEECSRTWARRAEEIERALTAKANAAEQRALKAEQRLQELLRAARDFGYADTRFREILNKNEVRS